MTIVSIDFSILYPGVCICRDFKTFKWIAGVNTHVTKKIAAKHQDVNSAYKNIDIFTTVSRRKTDPEYHITERTKMTNYFEVVSTLIDRIKSEVGQEELIISLEGISFGSSGNSLVDLSQSTGILKAELGKLLDDDLSRFFIFSPGTLKNSIGCLGNAGKLDVLKAFMSDPIIPGAKKSDLYKLLKNEDWVIDRHNRIVSPITDMIDAYLGITQLYRLYNP